MIPVALQRCLLIQRSCHLFKALSPDFSKESPSPASGGMLEHLVTPNLGHQVQGCEAAIGSEGTMSFRLRQLASTRDNCMILDKSCGGSAVDAMVLKSSVVPFHVQQLDIRAGSTDGPSQAVNTYLDG